MRRLKSRPLQRRTRLSKQAVGRLPKREAVRRLASLGLSLHDEESVVTEALAIVARFRRFTQDSACCVTGWRTGEVHDYQGGPWQVVVQWAHITGTRGAWHGDFGVAAPLCDLLHRWQEDDPEFFAKRDLDPLQLAKAHALRFLEAHPDDARWLLEHAADGDVLALAQASIGAGAGPERGG